MIDRTARLDPATLFVGQINPRRTHDRAPQVDLVASIRAHGVLVPLLVRPCEDGRYEVVAGSRRLAAAQEIGLPDVPCIIRSCDDAEARALALVDNLQREDVHPLEEAEGYSELQATHPSTTVDVLAAQVGRSVTYIRRRLALRQLSPPAAEACRSGEITIAHAEELARLAPDVQPRALEEGCFQRVLDFEAMEAATEAIDVRRRELLPLRRLKEWIRAHTKIDITQPETIALFPQLAELPADAEPPLEISIATCAAKDVPAGVLPLNKWRAAEAKREQCAHRRRAVVVHDGGFGRSDVGQIRWVCAHRKCATHFPQRPKPGSRSADRASRPSWEEQEAQRKRDQAAYNRLLDAAVTVLAEQTRGLPLTDDALVGLLRETTADDDLRRVITLVGGAITIKTFGQALVLVDALSQSWPGARPDLARICKAHGVDLKKIEREIAKRQPAESPATAALKRAAAKKPRKTSHAKKGRSS